jgi:hypothetical protein
VTSKKHVRRLDVAAADKGGVPAAQTAADLLALDDGALGAALVSALSAKDPRHSNFAALGWLVRVSVRGLGDVGAGYLEEILRRPGKTREQMPKGTVRTLF